MRTKKKVSLDRNAPVINIGATDKGIAAARNAVMDILNCEKAGDAPKVAALETLKTLCHVNATIQNCNFEMK